MLGDAVLELNHLTEICLFCELEPEVGLLLRRRRVTTSIQPAKAYEGKSVMLSDLIGCLFESLAENTKSYSKLPVPLSQASNNNGKNNTSGTEKPRCLHEDKPIWTSK